MGIPGKQESQNAKHSSAEILTWNQVEGIIQRLRCNQLLNQLTNWLVQPILLHLFPGTNFISLSTESGISHQHHWVYAPPPKKQELKGSEKYIHKTFMV